jgi:hypothetical protein
MARSAKTPPILNSIDELLRIGGVPEFVTSFTGFALASDAHSTGNSKVHQACNESEV